MEEVCKVKQIADNNILNSVLASFNSSIFYSPSHQTLPKSMFLKSANFLCEEAHKALCKCFIAYGAGVGADERTSQTSSHPQVIYNGMYEQHKEVLLSKEKNS